MFKDAIYIDGRMVRSVEDSVGLQVLQSPYVYRTVRTSGYAVEQAKNETQALNCAFGEVFGGVATLETEQLTRAVEQILTRNHYPSQQIANVEVRLHATEGRAVLCVVGGQVLMQEHYELSVIRPTGKECVTEMPKPEHFTSFGRQVLELTPASAKEVRLVRQAGRLVACEGFPLWGVEERRVVRLTPWESLESQRAEEVFRRAGIEFEQAAEVDESRLCELFFFGTNELVSLSRALGRAMEPFVAFRLADYLF
ncbi:MAG: hypothetical protein J6K81_06280 [Rikenellaceae bacterium]|nr:hypothetical protein [Rikenellaceae bacterium]